MLFMQVLCVFVPPKVLYAAVPGIQHWTLVRLASNTLVVLHAWHMLQMVSFLVSFVSCACMLSLCLSPVAQMHVPNIYLFIICMPSCLVFFWPVLDASLFGV